MFDKFKEKLQTKFKGLLKDQTCLFVTDVDKDLLWETYLGAFPEEEKQEHTCNSCRQFVKNYGNIVAIVNNKIVSIWDFTTDNEIWNNVTKHMKELVTSKPVKEVFVTDQRKLGTDFNFELMHKWTHLYFELPQVFVKASKGTIDTVRAQFRDQKNVFKRALDEIPFHAIETVLELINQNSLYRGAEFKGVLEKFWQCRNDYARLPVEERDNYAWANSIVLAGTVAKIRNTSIGTLLIDLSEDMDLDIAVSRFEKIMAPTNYKRPTPIVSKKMIEDAEKTIQQLGYMNSLGRKLCTPDDLSVNNLFFVDRDAKAKTGIFDELKDNAPINPREFTKVEEISLEDFIDKVIPTASSVEILVENKHTSNLVSLIGPTDKDAPSLFKWPNGFSWSYRNALADSLKEKVKTAGGKVDGLLRISLEWFNYNDLDLYLKKPDRDTIFFGNKAPLGKDEGHLDVDMNINPESRTPVENIIFPYGSKLLYGKYEVAVQCYTYRENLNPNIKVEIEHDGEIHDFSYNQVLGHKKNWRVTEFNYTKDGIKFTDKTKSTVASQKVWEIDTNKFHKVSMGMFSPNYWDGNKIGNKHIFFAIDGAVNNDQNVRGFFNEFLNPDLEKSHKKVFEILAGRMKVEKPEGTKQISGLGFSTTQNNSFICKVTGSFTRTLKVNV
jgi:hypothetical protein